MDDALALGNAAGMKSSWINTGSFSLLAQTRINQPGLPIRVYIEGDGFAYVTRGQPSIDPSPINPVALRLAAVDTSANIAWVARPCQYVMLAQIQDDCPLQYWTSHRMAPEVVEALGAALSKIANGGKIELVGYSGGGAAAVLLAARRSDVINVRTVAGNLDLEAFARHHRLAPMRYSLDASSVADRVSHLPQLHFVGAKDEIVPPELQYNFIKRVGEAGKSVTVASADHQKGWGEAWPGLLQRHFPTKH
ncbi:MAG: alpha/beta hydrolase [Alphaproteobacteria bacterium]|nr:alpha/beta hydrolase [Alphaproteobacteria bacterium]